MTVVPAAPRAFSRAQPTMFCPRSKTHFPGCGWLRLPRETLDALLAFRSRHALPSWEATVRALLAAADGAGPATRGFPAVARPTTERTAP